MKTYIAILRGINVSGKNKIQMKELKELFENLGFSDITTYIQSGNVIFRADAKMSDKKIAAEIEKSIREKFGYEVPVIVRTKEEWILVAEQNPFFKEPSVNREKLHVTFLEDAPSPELVSSFSKLDFSPDRFIISGKEVYLYIPESYGETKLSNKFIESKLKVKATTRNWNTTIKLAEMSGS
jgi:uncharacterized protein (DUF1697 family)